MKNADDLDPISSLSALGFTELEASVYTYLVSHSPATGYRVSHDIGKPIANVYKAVESLHQKGAVIVDESGENRQVFAVEPQELLEQLTEAFSDRHRVAAQALQSLESSDHDDGVYALTHRDQVVTRARTMLGRSREVALCDLFPQALRSLRDELEEAAARGATVVAKVYEPAELEGVETVVSSRGDDLIDQWPGQWMNLVIDETELLLSFLDEDGASVRQAIWTGSTFISVVYHIAFSWEITGSRIERFLERELPAEAALERIRSLITDFQRLEAPEAEGYQQISEVDPGDGKPPVADLLSDDPR